MTTFSTTQTAPIRWWSTTRVSTRCWPSFAEVPTGWAVALEESSRAEDLGVRWTDMRPRSLVREMEIAGNGAGAVPL
jgi:hypothetical protein